MTGFSFLRTRPHAIPIAIFAALLLLVLSVNATALAAPSGKPLQIYFADVEGGQATLFVTPAGQSLLIDTGWPGNNGRDADRIVALARQAKLTKIDYVLITHFHTDHVGGVPQLAARIPIGAFLDHGPNRESTDKDTTAGWEAYQKVLAEKHIQHMTMKPGDSLPIQGIESTVISAEGDLIAGPLPGTGAENPYCKQSETRPPDQTENARSLGTLLTYGKLRILDLGDLTWDKEMQLMCPVNRLGHIDILVVSHHGWYQSSSPALVDAIGARVAVMDNGAKKGGSPAAWTTIHSAPGLEDLWQLHYSDEGGPAHNVAAGFIANPQGPDAGHSIKLMAYPDGSFDVSNSRTGTTKHYAAH